MNALVTAAAPVEALSPEIADALLAEAVEQPVFASLAEGLEAIRGTKAEYLHLGQQVTLAENAYFAARAEQPDTPDEAVRTTDDAWVALRHRRQAMADAALAMPVASVGDVLLKLDAHRLAYGEDKNDAYCFKDDAAAALDAATRDLRWLAEAADYLPADPINFAGGLARYDAMAALRAALPHTPAADGTWDDLYDAQWDLLKALVRTPCSTLAGAAAKVKALLRLMERGGGSDWTDEHDQVGLQQLDAFLAGFMAAPVTTPIKALRDEAEAAAALMELADQEVAAAGLEADGPRAEVAALAMETHCGELAAVEDRILREHCQTFADAVIKAKLAADHGGDKDDVEGPPMHEGAPMWKGDDFGTAVARALVRDLVALGEGAA